METIIKNIKNFFSKKEKGEETGASPIGMCPTCWGHSEWEGEYYEIRRDHHSIQGEDIYDSFISKIVDEHVRTTHDLKEKRICITCSEDIS